MTEELPLTYEKDVFPSQEEFDFEEIRLFSTFDSGNLAKVMIFIKIGRDDSSV